MEKHGLLELKMYSVKGLRNQEEDCLVKLSASDVCINARVPTRYIQQQPSHFLPITDKIQIELHCGLQDIGYFELPTHSILDAPNKKHVVAINCITKDTTENAITEIVFGRLTLSIKFLENCCAKLDLLIERMEMLELKNQLLDRQMFVECKISDNSLKTTARRKAAGGYEWKERFNFTLNSIPSRIELSIVDKDMVNDDVLGKIELDPQREGLLALGSVKERSYEISDESRRIVLFVSAYFSIPQIQ